MTTNVNLMTTIYFFHSHVQILSLYMSLREGIKLHLSNITPM